jgi:DNA repair protein RecN (Recombination protein N)
VKQAGERNMLYQLTIENIALIDKLTMEFQRGLCILTGETGAGKSIIVDAVNLVLGGRADRDLIRAGADKAIVEAYFIIPNNHRVSVYLDELGIPDENGTIILSRELSSNGRNVCRINGRLVTLSYLRDVSRHLVDIHGQHEHQSLLSVENHQNFLDQYGGKTTANYLREVKEVYEQWKQTNTKIRERFGNEQERERRIDMLRFQIAEIEQARLTKGEEEELIKQRSLSMNSERISNSLNKAYQSLYAGSEKGSSMMEGLGEIISDFAELSHLDPVFTDIHRVLEDIYFAMEDISFRIRDIRDEYDYDPHLIDEIEKRLDTINTLKRKYGRNIEEVILYLEKAKTELDDMERNHMIIEELQKEKKQLEEKLLESSLKLSHFRKKLAIDFEKIVMKQLAELGMGKARFKLKITSPPENAKAEDITSSYSEKGFDQIEFLISPNPGEPLKPLTKIISGGEMSRVMLALKNIGAAMDEIDCMIFDEVDTGISGRIAQTVGEKLVQISKKHQVICITHLPQIASMADMHYVVEKISKDDTTMTHVKKLNLEDHYREIARMLGGSRISSLGLDHAKEMVEQAHTLKSKLRGIS